VSVYCFSLAPQDSVSEGANLSSVIFSDGPPLLQGGHSCLWWHCQSHDIIKSVLVSICQICHGLLWLLYAHQEFFDSARLSNLVDVVFAPILLYSFYKVAWAPLRSVEYWEIGRKRHTQLSLLLRAITLHCDLQLFCELMPNQEVATKDLVKTPNTQGGHVPNIPVPDGALNSEDNNSFILLDTESEGDFGLNHLWWWICWHSTLYDLTTGTWLSL